ncbi:MAG: hypothetical protein ACTSPN_10115 [Promethearchaeota archaeon]
MTRTYVKGRASKDKRTGFKRNGWKSHCQCSYCNGSPREKGWKKTNERNEINLILKEYTSIKSGVNNLKTIKLLVPMSMS